MSAIPYTFAVLRYVHDPAAGEMLNVGVVLCAPAQRYVSARLEHRYERLSNAFAGFDGDHYRKTIRQFEAALRQLQERCKSGSRDIQTPPTDAGAVVTSIWPDVDLSFRAGLVLAGLTNDLDGTLERLFERMVTSQQKQRQADAEK
jgi:hypothetical protein